MGLEAVVWPVLRRMRREPRSVIVGTLGMIEGVHRAWINFYSSLKKKVQTGLGCQLWCSFNRQVLVYDGFHLGLRRLLRIGQLVYSEEHWWWVEAFPDSRGSHGFRDSTYDCGLLLPSDNMTVYSLIEGRGEACSAAWTARAMTQNRSSFELLGMIKEISRANRDSLIYPSDTTK